MTSKHEGKTFGDLTVLQSFFQDRPSGSGRRQVFAVRCACGEEFVVPAQKVVDGVKRCCPKCVKARFAARSAVGHDHPLHKTWHGMITRCYDPQSPSYATYGGRGIRVCDRWLGNRKGGEIRTIDGFYAFVADMGERPGGKYEYTVDRIDNDGDYTPENCRWATYEEQQNNRRDNVRVTAFEKTLTVAQWARELGVPPTWAQAARTYGVALEDAVEMLSNTPQCARVSWQTLFGVTPKTPIRRISEAATRDLAGGLDTLFDDLPLAYM